MNPTGLPPPDIAVQQLNALRQAEQRARFRALLPLIDELISQGVSHAAIVTALAKTGISLKTASVRQALYRWRKQQTHPGAGAASDSAASARPEQLPPPPQPIRSPVGIRHGGITSKADLVRLRKSQESIDLNQLAELSRQK